MTPTDPMPDRSPAAPVPLPTRRPAATDRGLFASRLRSAPPAGADPDFRAVAGSVPRAAATVQEYREQVGRRIRLARSGAALTQDEVAARAGVTRNFVSAVERGTQGLDAWRLGQVADTLEVTLAWLLGRSDDPAR